MSHTTPAKVLLLENEPAVLEKIREILIQKLYDVNCFSSSGEALKALRNAPCDLLITGQNAEGKDPIEVVKNFVMTSPMSSIVMVTDLSDGEVHEKAEGYGILGNIGRTVPSEHLLSLLNTHEKIRQSLGQKLEAP